jgi:hypothetical protein
LGIAADNRVLSGAELEKLYWLLCAAVASSVLWLRELSKLAIRLAAGRSPAVGAAKTGR